MKYNAQNLAKALQRLIQENPDNYSEIIDGFVLFCKEKNLIYLIPNLLKYLKLEIKKDEDIKTLKIFSAGKINENIIKKIQNLAVFLPSDTTEVVEDQNIVAGFIAYYKNKIIDASLVSNLNLLKNKLINN